MMTRVMRTALEMTVIRTQLAQQDADRFNAMIADVDYLTIVLAFPLCPGNVLVRRFWSDVFAFPLTTSF